MIWGYGRVSATDQNLETQIEQLEKYGCDKIVTEKITGIAEEKELNRLLLKLNQGDSLVATRMDRLGRSAKQLMDFVEELQLKKVNLIILDMNIDTKTATGKFFLQIMAAFSELERTNLKEKQLRGIENAKKKGKHLGRPRGWNKTALEYALELYQQGDKTVKEICEITSVSRASLYRELKERGMARD
jgi:DNA invertase Pin-like site-specific DNA recombinase